MFVTTTTFPRRTLNLDHSVRIFDRAVAQFAATAAAPSPQPTLNPATSGRFVDSAYEITVDLPGVPTESVHVAVTGRTLTVDVSTADAEWSRSLRLPQTLDPEQVTARYLDGRLTVSIGKVAQPPQPEARTVTIDTTPAPKPELVVEATGDEPAASDPVGAAQSGDGSNVTE